MMIFLLTRERDEILTLTDKFQATVDCLDVKTKTTELLRQMLLDLRCQVSFHREIKL